MNLRKTFNENGFVLALTLLCALILSSVMVSTMFVSTKGQKVTKNFKESVQTLNAADAAVKQAKQALATWLTNTQMGSGTQTSFSAVLAASGLTSTAGSSGTLVIPGNATNWGNMTYAGNSVVVTISNTEGTAASGSTDTDRIITVQADATSATRQRVRIRANVQAPSSSNVGSISLVGLQGGLSMCSDVAGLNQTVSFSGSSFITGNNITAKPNTFVAGSILNLPPIVLSSLAHQTVSTSGSADMEGNPNTVQSMTGNCTALQNMVNQIALLSNKLPNVQYITGGATGNTTFGTTANPKITIVTGDATGTSNISFSGNTSGVGILLIQAPVTTMAVDTGISGNFNFDGLVILYGDGATNFTTSGNSSMYGGIVVLSGSDNHSYEQFTGSGNTTIAYDKASLAYADSAIGSVNAGTPITQRDDARNTVITVGWYEDYNF